MKLRLLLLHLAASATLFSQTPRIAYRGVLNAASFTPAGLPGGGIAQGSFFSIFGQSLGPATPAEQISFPLQTSFSGVSVTVSQGGTTVAVIPVFVSSSQINAIMPSNAPLGLDALQVTFNGLKSSNSPVRVVNASVGIVSVSGLGNGPVSYTHLTLPTN